ncbi:hypothetical protein ABE096_21240 [Robertmurraya massiliosenegalensis]|uniref:hypothetical protein n=1 Tax=Robertmurraya TaxID=2837507 RepID=UPI0039A5869B
MKMIYKSLTVFVYLLMGLFCTLGIIKHRFHFMLACFDMIRGAGHELGLSIPT